MNSAFPTGAMWGAAEAHARRLIHCVSVKLFAAATAGTGPEGARGGGAGDSDGGSGGGLYRCTEQTDWKRSPPTVRSHRHQPPCCLGTPAAYAWAHAWAHAFLCSW